MYINNIHLQDEIIKNNYNYYSKINKIKTVTVMKFDRYFWEQSTKHYRVVMDLGELT